MSERDNWWAREPGWALLLPDRLSDTWRWFEALWAYDYGDTRQLSELIRTEAIPPEYTDAVAKIVAGDRKPNRKAAAKAKIPASERAQTATLVSVAQGLRDKVKYDAIDPALDPNRENGTGAAAIAKTHEPIEIMRSADELGRDCLETAAKEWGVSTETIENLIREAKARLSRWPEV